MSVSSIQTSNFFSHTLRSPSRPLPGPTSPAARGEVKFAYRDIRSHLI
jgi:hypothetical protein